jgi:hypothetical protein
MNPSVAFKRRHIYGIVEDRRQVMEEHWGRRDSAAPKHDEDKDPGDGNFQTIRDHGTWIPAHNPNG